MHAVMIVGVAASVFSALLLPAAGSAQTISSCVAKTGSIRIITSGGCGKGETPLEWNAEGATGPAGRRVLPERQGRRVHRVPRVRLEHKVHRGLRECKAQ
jgi:hypothetical protein